MKRTAEFFDLFSRPLRGLRLAHPQLPAVSRWAIFNRPMQARPRIGSTLRRTITMSVLLTALEALVYKPFGKAA